jgi:hypothetical protein
MSNRGFTSELWEAWFEEHPDGWVFFILEDESLSPVLSSTEEADEFAAKAREGQRPIQMIPVRNVSDHPGDA